MRLEQLLQFLERTPDEPFVWFALAKEYEKGKDDANALHYYQKLVTEKPDYIGTYYHFGKWYERQNRLEEALHIYTQGIEKAKQQGDRHAWSELAEAKMAIEE